MMVLLAGGVIAGNMLVKHTIPLPLACYLHKLYNKVEVSYQ